MPSGLARTVVLVVISVLALVVLGGGSCGYLVFRSIRMSDPFRMAVEEAGHSHAVREALGEPLDAGLFTTGTVRMSGSTGEASLRIPLQGPKGEGTLQVEAVKKTARSRSGPWTMTRLKLDRADLLPGARLRALDRDCAAGIAAACNNLGLEVATGREGRDPAAGLGLLERACALGNADGCVNIGVVYQNGHGVEKDLPRARDQFERLCDAGSLSACTGLGEWYLAFGTHDAGELRRAASALERACDGRFAEACSALGVIHQNGWGRPRDAARAAALYEQSCEGGYALGCSNLGEVLARGNGVPVDRRRAAAFLGRACDGGVRDACARRAEVLEPPG